MFWERTVNKPLRFVCNSWKLDFISLLNRLLAFVKVVDLEIQFLIFKQILHIYISPYFLYMEMESARRWKLGKTMEPTGCSVYYLPKVSFCSSETVHILPYVCKAKMCWKGGWFFWKIVNKQLKNVNKFSNIEKKLLPLKRILVLST